jgi:hypothetical protein
MARIKQRVDKNAPPAVLLIHYLNKRGVNMFKLVRYEEALEKKEELINKGAENVTIPYLDYKNREAGEVK